MGQTASFKPKITKIGPPVWPVEVSKKIIGKERKGKGRKGIQKSHKSVIFHACVGAKPLGLAQPNFYWLLRRPT